MPRLSFTLRDVFWLTLVARMGCAWIRDRFAIAEARHDIADMVRASEMCTQCADPNQWMTRRNWHIT
jgi:hypothetical protein